MRNVLRTFILLLLAGAAVGQRVNANFVVRIREFRMKQLTCAVLTSDGKLRWQVTHVWPSEPPQMYEATATEQDRLKVEDLLGRPELQQVDSNTIPNVRLGPDGRMVTIEFVKSGKPLTSTFVDEDGRKSAPAYVREALDFGKLISKRKLTKMAVGTASLCPAIAAR